MHIGIGILPVIPLLIEELMSIDLHIHSNHSDGTFSPQEIVSLAVQKGLTAISITDHDTVTGVEEAVASGMELGVEVVPGIEMSVRYERGPLHILGYFIDYNDADFLKSIQILQEARTTRNKAIIRKLVQTGIDISYEEVLEFSREGQTGRPHIARVLVEKGVVASINEAFHKYLGGGKIAYEPRFLYDPEQTIDLIKQSGGLSVMAHPALLSSDVNELEAAIRELKSAGLDGIETYYPRHCKSFRKKLKKIAEKYDLVITGGSDYHGHIRPGTDLAGGVHFNVPRYVFDDLKNRYTTLQDASR